MKFPENNNIPYMQDHFFTCDIPSDVDFDIYRIAEGRYKLVGFGYGQLKPYSDKSYGNGSLFILGSNLPENLLKEVVKYAKEDKVF